MKGKLKNSNSASAYPQSPVTNPCYYPAFINLKGKKCAVIGGGKIAERKVSALLNAGADVKVISPTLTKKLLSLKKIGDIEHIERGYRKGDLKGAFLVIAATSDEDINRRVSKDAPGLVNVVDCPELANFIVPSVVNRGLLTIAISTSGASPAVSKRIRKELELLYGRDFGLYMNYLKKLRERVIKEISDKKLRERFLKELASKEIITIVRERGFKEAKLKLDKTNYD